MEPEQVIGQIRNTDEETIFKNTVYDQLTESPHIDVSSERRSNLAGKIIDRGLGKTQAMRGTPLPEEEEKLLEQIRETETEEKLYSVIHDNLVDYVTDHDITEEEINEEEIRKLTRSFLDMGLLK